jgi:hypothetical protein
MESWIDVGFHCIMLYVIYLIYKKVENITPLLEREIDYGKLAYVINKARRSDERLESFLNASELPISYFKFLKKGQVVKLISSTYYDVMKGSTEVVHFDYKHDHIDKEDQTRNEWEVHGFEKYHDDEWSHVTLLANKEKCRSSNRSATVKKV